MIGIGRFCTSGMDSKQHLSSKIHSNFNSRYKITKKLQSPWFLSFYMEKILHCFISLQNMGRNTQVINYVYHNVQNSFLGFDVHARGTTKLITTLFGAVTWICLPSHHIFRVSLNYVEMALIHSGDFIPQQTNKSSRQYVFFLIMQGTRPLVLIVAVFIIDWGWTEVS